MNYKLVAYAQDFVSFLMQNLKQEMDTINAIILFGSVARGQAGKDSDIDLFIETKNKKIEEKIQQVIEDFYSSIKYKQYWKLLRVTNDIKCMVGELEKWPSLKRSIVSGGLVLFDSYKAKFEANPYSLFKIEGKEKRSESIKIWRKLYGYKQKVDNKEYYSEGLLEKYGGKKIAKGIFLVPMNHCQKFIDFFHKEKMKYSLLEFWTDARV